jgi:hypothetical protein
MTAVDVSKIFGTIRIVKRFPDYKVQIVTEGADLQVELVHTCCYEHGMWKLVSYNGNYKIMIVKSHPDFTISCPDPVKPVR